MRFEWDEAKRKSNIIKHGLDFVDAKYVFQGITFTFIDDRFDYDEQRFNTLGMLKGIVVAIAHTEQDDLIRIISMRKATKNEQKIYFKGFTDGLGTH
jgi:uncharacterized DUF497 family protein